MKEVEFEKLVEKYNEGDSSLKEEQLLFNNAKNSEHSLEAWSTFVKNNKKEIPKDFNDTLWESFQNKKTIKRKEIIKIMSVAATVLLIISLFVGNLKLKEQSYSEKEVLLNQALNMFHNTTEKEVKYNIFYENEMIIVYTTTY